MKNSKTQEWEASKIGDKASKTFASAGKPTKSPKSKTVTRKSNVAIVSKTIRNKTPVKKGKTKVVKAVKTEQIGKKPEVIKKNDKMPKKEVGKKSKVSKKASQNESSVLGKSPKKIVNRGKKKVDIITPQTPQTNGNTPKEKTLKKSPKKVVKPEKGAKKKKVNNTIPKTPQTNGDTPRGTKRTNLQVIVTPVKVQKLQTPQKSGTTSSKKPLTTPKTTSVKSKTSKARKSPSPKKTSPIKTLKTTTTSPKSPKQQQKTASKQKTTHKISPTSKNIKKSTQKKTKTKIKIAGLLARKIPVVNSAESGKKPNKGEKKHGKLVKALSENSKVKKVKKSRAKIAETTPLRVKMMDRLQSARFRYINEELYTKDSSGAVQLFHEDPQAFAAYHDGYRQQVKKWPINPLTKIIQAIKKMPRTVEIADFGCGDAELAKSVKQKVHSFDLVAANDTVTACDMAHVPLKEHSVDVAVFSLSLMGTNLHDYILEANRVLKVGGTLMIAEVESRFDEVDTFIAGLTRYGFKNIYKNFEHNLFYFMHFRKERDVKNKKNLPTMSLNPCIYKKR